MNSDVMNNFLNDSCLQTSNVALIQDFSIQSTTNEQQPAKKMKEKFTCDICHKYYSSKSYLRYHQNTHTGSKPYLCRVTGCQKAFISPTHRYMHEKSCKKKLTTSNQIDSLSEEAKQWLSDLSSLERPAKQFGRNKAPPANQGPQQDMPVLQDEIDKTATHTLPALPNLSSDSDSEHELLPYTPPLSITSQRQHSPYDLQRDLKVSDDESETEDNSKYIIAQFEQKVAAMVEQLNSDEDCVFIDEDSSSNENLENDDPIVEFKSKLLAMGIYDEEDSNDCSIVEPESTVNKVNEETVVSNCDVVDMEIPTESDIGTPDVCSDDDCVLVDSGPIPIPISFPTRIKIEEVPPFSIDIDPNLFDECKGSGGLTSEVAELPDRICAVAPTVNNVVENQPAKVIEYFPWRLSRIELSTGSKESIYSNVGLPTDNNSINIISHLIIPPNFQPLSTVIDSPASPNIERPQYGTYGTNVDQYTQPSIRFSGANEVNSPASPDANGANGHPLYQSGIQLVGAKEVNSPASPDINCRSSTYASFPVLSPVSPSAIDKQPMVPATTQMSLFKVAGRNEIIEYYDDRNWMNEPNFAKREQLKIMLDAMNPPNPGDYQFFEIKEEFEYSDSEYYSDS